MPEEERSQKSQQFTAVTTLQTEAALAAVYRRYILRGKVAAVEEKNQKKKKKKTEKGESTLTEVAADPADPAGAAVAVGSR